MNKEEKQFIDRFLENKLTGFELKNFHDRMETDVEFRKKVGFHNLLVESIIESEDKRLAELIRIRIAYKKPRIPFGLKLIVAFFMVTAMGIVLWNYLEPDSEKRRNYYLSLDFLKRPVESQQVVSSKELKAENANVPNPKRKVSTDRVVDSSNENESNSTNESNNSSMIKNDDIIVKKDQLLISLSIKPKEIDLDSVTKSVSKGNSTRSVSEALNPSADLPQDNLSNNPSYIVEFWVSPVNYSGYKLSENKLILFGIDEPDAIKLYSRNNVLWMKYGHEFYILERNDEFESLKLSSEKLIQN